jgi:hypothetical protein
MPAKAGIQTANKYWIPDNSVFLQIHSGFGKTGFWHDKK